MSRASPLDFRVIPLLTTEPMGRFSTAGPLAVRRQTYETGTIDSPPLLEPIFPAQGCGCPLRALVATILGRSYAA